MPPVMLIPLAFLAGSIPFGYLIGLARGVDIRRHGSGNIGATNVGRVLGRRWGVLCFALDVLKGVGPTLAAGAALGLLGHAGDAPLGATAIWLGAMAAAILGHIYTPWLGFKGGKGVATGFGAVMGVWPMLTVPALLAFVVWYAALKVWRYVSLASVLAALSLPMWVAAFALTFAAGGHGAGPGERTGSWAGWPYVTVAVVLAGLVIAKHRANLQRLRAGTEPKVGRSNGSAGVQ